MTVRTVHEFRDEARSARGRGDLARAREALTSALAHTVAREEEYVLAVRDLRDVCTETGDHRAALTLDWYAGSERTQRAIIGLVPPLDRARTLLAWAEASDNADRARSIYARAANEYEASGLIAQAAIACEKSGDDARARALWSRLSQVLSGSGADLYAAGLTRFNLARLSLKTGDASSAREAVVGSVYLLQEAADQYETIGQRERAFDCFQVLIAIGRQSQTFEHVLEGYVNVIRILREDHLRYYALQSYEEAVSAAEKQGEMAAAATLSREMASYARNEGLSSVSTFATLAQARLWQEVAMASRRRRAPPELAENALLAAVIALGEAGQYKDVEHVFGALAGLPLEKARVDQYTRVIKRYARAENQRTDAAPLPAHLRQEGAFPDVWHVDLIEWEQRGSASQACADILLTPNEWAEVTRRRALVARLSALAVESPRSDRPPSPDAAPLVKLADELSLVGLYSILAPLEHMLRHPASSVRAAVARGLSRFLYKRTFIALRTALTDADPSVVRDAAQSLRELHFPHAFDPLARIYRESVDRNVRASALHAIARIDTIEASEMILSVIEHEAAADRAAATRAAGEAGGARFVDLARDRLPQLTGAAAKAVRDILQHRANPGRI